MYGTIVVAGTLLVAVGDTVAAGAGPRGWGWALVWAALCGVANLLPAPAARNIYLSMSSPVNVAVALLFPPGAAALVVAAGSVSEWELRGETSPGHALFNRCQLGLSTAAASLWFGGPRTDLPPWWALPAGLVAYQLANWVLVALAERTARGTPVAVVLRRLLPANPLAALTYLTLGALGVVLALTSVQVGLWSVPLLLLPLLGARQAVTASRRLEEAERERRRLADRLVDERERERLRIASDIHDLALQDLAAVQLQADTLRAALEAGDADLARRLSGGIRTSVDDTIAALRRTLARLPRARLDDGLAAAIDQHSQAVAATTGLSVRCQLDHELAARLPTTAALLLFEAVQEGLSNVARHAGATSAEIQLRSDGDTVVLEVADDGRGPGAAQPPVAATTEGQHLGLGLLAEKAALAGGASALEAPPGGGTVLRVRLPDPGR